ncbi:MAG: prephenate dehydratase [Candidatus Hydrothermarchaeales archaeon]
MSDRKNKAKVALLGPRGTFSEEAALKFFEEPEFLLAEDIEEIFVSVSKGRSPHGLVPVENSIEGAVGMTLEMLLREDVRIYGEIILNVRHLLLAQPGVKLSEVMEVISHPHALAQCKIFLKGLGVKTRNFSSTAEAARHVAELKSRETAAIAPRISALIYGLEILKEDIQDEELNQTRFLVISKKDHTKAGNDKTSLILGLKDKHGALYQALGAFAELGINLTKIESRPSRKALGDYIFYIDLEGHREEVGIKHALKELKRQASFMKILGSYPKG